MQVYMVQKQHNGIATCHYETIKVYTKFSKALKHIASLGLVPTNFHDTTQFIHEKIKEFGTVKYYGVQDENREVRNKYRIITMDVEE